MSTRFPLPSYPNLVFPPRTAFTPFPPRPICSARLGSAVQPSDHNHSLAHTAVSLSPSSQPEGARNQAEALRAEGVAVTRGALGELMVDFDEYGWFPRALPSGDGDDGDDDDLSTDGDEDDDEGEEAGSEGGQGGARRGR